MNKPYLLCVTGKPGAGKTTLARQLGDTCHLPVLSRDGIKEGIVHTQGMSHAQLADTANRVATGIFFETVEFLLRRGVSLIAEAAFQHAAWEKGLAPCLPIARVSLMICYADDETVRNRILQRERLHPKRAYFHGEAIEGGLPHAGSFYDEPHPDIRTLHIDTTKPYGPILAELAKEILGFQENP